MGLRSSRDLVDIHADFLSFFTSAIGVCLGVMTPVMSWLGTRLPEWGCCRFSGSSIDAGSYLYKSRLLVCVQLVKVEIVRVCERLLRESNAQTRSVSALGVELDGDRPHETMSTSSNAECPHIEGHAATVIFGLILLAGSIASGNLSLITHGQHISIVQAQSPHQLDCSS